MPAWRGVRSYFEVEGGGGQLLDVPSPASGAAAAALLERHGLPSACAAAAAARSPAAAVRSLTRVQGCQLWEHPPGLAPVPLSDAQRQELIGHPETGGGGGGSAAAAGLDEAQLAILRAEVCRPTSQSPRAPAATPKRRRRSLLACLGTALWWM